VQYSFETKYESDIFLTILYLGTSLAISKTLFEEMKDVLLIFLLDLQLGATTLCFLKDRVLLQVLEIDFVRVTLFVNLSDNLTAEPL
jgi:hypothetical protein